MEGTQVFSCKSGNNMKNLFAKKDDAMFLKVENDKISGKGYVCNTEGKNGYIDEFSVEISKITAVMVSTYLGEPALAINTRLDNLYGSKKVQLVFPQLKNMDLAEKLLNKLRGNSGEAEASAAPAPAANPGTIAPAPIRTSGATLTSGPIGTGSALMNNVAAQRNEKPVANPYEVIQTGSPVKTPPPAGLGSALMGSGKPLSPVPPKPLSGGSAPTTPVATSPVKPAAPAAPVAPVAPAVSTAPQRAKGPAPVPTPVPVQISAPHSSAASEEDQRKEDEFNERIEKLTVLKDCGILGEKEFNAKKFELVSEFCDLTDFNEKIQKLVVLKDCGLLSETEFEGNRTDIIKECCDTETDDPAVYRKNIQKLVYLEMGGIISSEEYAKNKKIMVDDVKFTLDDEPAVFVRKLKRLPVLKISSMMTDAEYKECMDDMFAMIELSEDDSHKVMVNKMLKWPILAQERVITIEELQEKQIPWLQAVTEMPLNTPDDVQRLSDRLLALKEGGWISEEDFALQKGDMVRRIDEIKDYTNRINMYVAMPKMGLATEEEYEETKDKCIAEIFAPYSGMSEFKERVNNLLILQKAGMLSEEDFVSYKTKLMADL